MIRFSTLVLVTVLYIVGMYSMHYMYMQELIRNYEFSIYLTERYCK